MNFQVLGYCFLYIRKRNFVALMRKFVLDWVNLGTSMAVLTSDWLRHFCIVFSIASRHFCFILSRNYLSVVFYVSNDQLENLPSKLTEYSYTDWSCYCLCELCNITCFYVMYWGGNWGLLF